MAKTLKEPLGAPSHGMDSPAIYTVQGSIYKTILFYYSRSDVLIWFLKFKIIWNKNVCQTGIFNNIIRRLIKFQIKSEYLYNSNKVKAMVKQRHLRSLDNYGFYKAMPTFWHYFTKIPPPAFRPKNSLFIRNRGRWFRIWSWFAR